MTRLSDDQFVALWNRSRSGAACAKRAGVALKTAYWRSRTLRRSGHSVKYFNPPRSSRRAPKAEFVAAWNAPATRTVADVTRAIGIHPPTARARAGKLRSQGVYLKPLKLGVYQRPIADRLAERLVARPGGCAEWTSKMQSGSPVICVAGQPLSVRRLVYVCLNGPIPAGFVLRPTCENSRCVAPAHMVVGPPVVGRAAVGEAGSMARFTTADVLDMRARRAAGESNSSIARRYDTDDSTVSKICLRKKWKHV